MQGDEEVFPPPTSKEVKELILRMLEIDPKARISLYDIMESTWMNMDDEDMEKSIEEAKAELEKEEEAL